MLDPDNPYTRMQKAFYVEEASKWSPENRDPVVGSFDAHNAWPDYEFLFNGLDTQGKLALDFGCGPGRNIVRFKDRFSRIDGCDIAIQNLVNADRWTKQHNAPPPYLFPINGVDLGPILNNIYDVVFSTICLQHIPVHEIRLNLFKEFYRVLKPEGWFTAQMGYGDSGGGDVDYYANNYEATATNGRCDVKVTAGTQLGDDLLKAKFDEESIDWKICLTGPSDRHPNWIFFRAQKP